MRILPQTITTAMEKQKTGRSIFAWNTQNIITLLAFLGFAVITHLRISILEQMHAIVNSTAPLPKATPQFSECSYHQPRSLRVHLIGGLGNQMWIYASAYGIGKKTGRNLIVCVNYDMRKVFTNLSAKVYTYKVCKICPHNLNDTLQVGQRNNHLYYDVETISILKDSKNPHAFICCYLQNLGYFLEYEKEIRSEFIIQDTLQSRAQEYLQKLSVKVANKMKRTITRSLSGKTLINSEPPVFVAVHVRRTDMLKEKHIAHPDASYFNRSMEYFRRKYKHNVIFSVASDDVRWIKANITGNDVYFTSETGLKSMEDEFAIAVACNHTVVSVGTYGWWMAYLSNGEVIYYKDWVMGGWNQWYHKGQYFPHNWKPM